MESAPDSNPRRTGWSKLIDAGPTLVAALAILTSYATSTQDRSERLLEQSRGKQLDEDQAKKAQVLDLSKRLLAAVDRCERDCYGLAAVDPGGAQFAGFAKQLDADKAALDNVGLEVRLELDDTTVNDLDGTYQCILRADKDATAASASTKTLQADNEALQKCEAGLLADMRRDVGIAPSGKTDPVSL